MEKGHIIFGRFLASPSGGVTRFGLGVILIGLGFMIGRLSGAALIVLGVLLAIGRHRRLRSFYSRRLHSRTLRRGQPLAGMVLPKGDTAPAVVNGSHEWLRDLGPDVAVGPFPAPHLRTSAE